MSMALRSGRAYPREADQDGAQGPPAAWTHVQTDPVNRRSYSDVVRTGSSSPVSESGKGSDVIYCRRPRSVSESNVGMKGSSIENPPSSWDAGTNTEANVQWGNVTGKGKKFKNSSPTPSVKSMASVNRFEYLRSEQIDAVEEAERQLTAAQLKLFQTRMRAREVPPEQSSSSSESHDKEPGPSKGKGIDPRNFGGLDISGSELDPDEQREAFALWNQVKRMRDQEQFNGKRGYSRSRKISPASSTASEVLKLEGSSEESTPEHSDYDVISNHDKSRCKADSHRRKHAKGREQKVSSAKGCSSGGCVTHKRVKCESIEKRSHSVLKPTQQLNKTSYLGKILENVGRPTKKRGKRRYDDSESSDAPDLVTETESSSESSSEPSGSGDSDPEPKRSGHKKPRKPKKPKSHGMKLKPIPPEIYDGTPDPQIFHKFLTQVQNYMDDGRVPPEKQVYRLADFVKGKAYDYYLSRVGRRPEKLTLAKCLKGLFNHCFPVDFRSQLRLRLKRCRQGPRSAREFIFELEQLKTMIGDVDKRELVNRLWYGCNKPIRSQLYLMNLHPEISSFRRVKKAIEIVEMALSVEGNNQSLSKADSPSKSQAKPHDSKNNGNNRQNAKSNGRNNNLNSLSSNSAHPKGKDVPNKKGSLTKNKSAPKLSSKERDELLAAGKCFRCKNVGHKSSDCPEGKTVQVNTVSTK